MAALEIRWETISRISAAKEVVVTGEKASVPTPAAQQGIVIDRPLAVLVGDEGTGSEGFDKLAQVVFKNEKVAIGMKAFRTVRMSTAQAEEDPLLAGKGTENPRILLVEPTEKKVTVVEKSKLSAGGLFSAMESISGKFYAQKLDKVVKEHLSLLTKQDQLVNEEKVLGEKETRLKEEDGAKAEKDLEKLKAERDALRKEQAELTTKQAALWKLTPKDKAA